MLDDFPVTTHTFSANTLSATASPSRSFSHPCHPTRHRRILASLLLSTLLGACGGHDDATHTGVPANSKDTTSYGTPANTRPEFSETTASDVSSPQATAQGQHTRHAPLTGKALVAASGNHSLLSDATRRLYGPGVFNQNALANTIIGTSRGTTRTVSNRFRATVSGHVDGVRLYWQPGQGYSAGSGGQIRLRILPDDGSWQHLPNLNAAPLATGHFTPGWGRTNTGAPIFERISLTSHQAIQTGQIYHLVMDNVDPAPHANYISSNNAMTIAGNGLPARWHSTTDWATLLGMQQGNGQYNWRDLTRDGSSGNHYIPILQIYLNNGQSQGSSNIEGGSVDSRLVFTATAHQPVRERFTPSSTKQVSGLSFATAASVGGSLRWQIKEGNTVLASGSVASWSPNYQVHTTRNGTRLAGQVWYDVNTPPVTLHAGRTYDVEFHPEGNSQWKFADRRNGSHHGFSWPAAFTESQAQHRRNGNWLDAYHWNYNTSRGGSNWPVVLHVD